MRMKKNKRKENRFNAYDHTFCPWSMIYDWCRNAHRQMSIQTLTLYLRACSLEFKFLEGFYLRLHKLDLIEFECVCVCR